MTTRIGFSTPKKFNPISWLVRKISGSTASHAFFIYSDKDWQADMVMEAHELGFRLIPLAHFEKKNEIVASFVPKQTIDDGVRFVALEYLGTVYDFGGLFGGALLMLGRWLKRKWHNPWDSSHAVFCSEAVVIAMQKTNYPGAGLLVARDTTPQDLLQFFTTEGAHAP
jgi:hypothetical protein